MKRRQRGTRNASVAATLTQATLHERWIDNLRTEEVQKFGFAALRRLLARTDLKAGDAVLDAGCGTGTNSRWLAAQGLNVTGADFSDFVLEQARARLDGIEYCHQDLTKLGFSNDSFDAVICVGVLMHIPEIEKALCEIVRVIRPGGWLIIAEANAWAPETYLFRGWWLLSRKDFEIVKGPRGVEVWAQTPVGPLLSRKMSPNWLTQFLASQGIHRISRTTGELTELYAYSSSKAARKILHKLNDIWLKIGGPPGMANANYYLFKKPVRQV
jgi:ubiquinone/menaquinone biosynthesis C-methylase UbiE